MQDGVFDKLYHTPGAILCGLRPAVFYDWINMQIFWRYAANMRRAALQPAGRAGHAVQQGQQGFALRLLKQPPAAQQLLFAV